MTTLTPIFDFPIFKGFTAVDLEGKTLEELQEMSQVLNEKLTRLQIMFNEGFCLDSRYTAEYRQARQPLEVSSGIMASALWPHYVFSTLVKQARVEAQRTAV
jgi:hypothetical protein